jgi:uncharacterized protein (TIGR03382 family)
MKRTVFGGVLAALLAASSVAVAEPVCGPRCESAEQRVDQQLETYLTCNSPGASSLLVAVAALGLILRRRR